MEKFKFLVKDKISQLPKTPGVYAFSAGKKFLYIGKAANIKERVNQHRKLINLTKHIAYIKTDSEIEALILEANLIKKYQPKYNVVWKDDKNYFYVGITKEDFPRVLIAHQTKENATYIGPFVEGKSLKRTLTFLRKVFPYYTTKKHPKGSCLWCGLRLCPGPNPDKKDYRKNIKNLIKILKGEKTRVLKNLKREMKAASNSQEFEKAAKIRDQIESLERILAHAKILELIEVRLQWDQWLEKRIEAYDVSNIQGEAATGSMVTFINGLPAKNFYRRFKIKNRASKGSEGEEEGESLFALQGKPDDIAMLKEVLSRRFNHPEWPYPDLILIDGGKAQLNAALKILTQHKSAKSALISVMTLAKKENKLYVEGRKKPLLLKNLPREIFNLILQLRDEAHRFAISYHHKLRKKALLGN